MRFVQIDFNQQKLEAVLENAGYEPSLQAVFVWEGVSNYLTAESVDSMLLLCANAGSRSRVVFTYIDKKVLVDPKRFMVQMGL